MSLRDRLGVTISSSFIAGAITNVSTAAAQIWATSVPLVIGVEIKALNANTGNVFLGDVNVTATGSTRGMELLGGQSFLMPVDQITRVYVVANVTSQGIAFFGV